MVREVRFSKEDCGMIDAGDVYERWGQFDELLTPLHPADIDARTSEERGFRNRTTPRRRSGRSVDCKNPAEAD